MNYLARSALLALAALSGPIWNAAGFFDESWRPDR
jgi:hypothetical protein